MMWNQHNPCKLPSVRARRQGVYVPEMCVELTTRRVLVMEWVDGVRLRSAATGSALPRGREDLRLVEIGVHCSLEQVRHCRPAVRLPSVVTCGRAGSALACNVMSCTTSRFAVIGNQLLAAAALKALGKRVPASAAAPINEGDKGRSS